MDPHIVLRHLSASKSGHVEEFPLQDLKEVTIGRDPSCSIQYDPDQEDLISRRHARIVVDRPDPPEFSISDLGSRNGTFVNKQRIFGPVKLSPGDVVQLGPGGPEFQFDLEPPLVGVARPTRLAEVAARASGPLAPTREAPAGPLAVPKAPAGSPAPAIGKLTVERMIAETQSKTRRNMIAGGLLLLAIIAAAATAMLLRKPVTKTVTVTATAPAAGMTATQIAATYTDAVVLVEASWKLVSMESGRQIYQVHVPNMSKKTPNPPASSRVPAAAGTPSKGKAPASAAPTSPPSGKSPSGGAGSGGAVAVAAGAGGAAAAAAVGSGGVAAVAAAQRLTRGVTKWVDIPQEFLPVFIWVDGKLEPMLTTDPGDGHNRAIGATGAGSGFVVSPDGFVITNRHVAASWQSVYDWQYAKAGLAVAADDEHHAMKIAPISDDDFPRGWIPSQAKFLTQGGFDPGSVRFLERDPKWKEIEGRNDFLEVGFAKNRIRIPSKLARISDHADAAMIKIDIPQSLHKVELNDNYETIRTGNTTTVMGYPGISPDVVGLALSVDPANRQAAWRTIPDPTLSAGNVGRVIRTQVGVTEASISSFGDVYQMTINSTGHGNSGGPVFDNDGKVIGIFTYGFNHPGDAAITFAVPIRYGIELMGVNKPQ